MSNNTKFVTGIGVRAKNATTPVSAADIASTRYVSAMQKQFQGIMNRYMKLVDNAREVSAEVLNEALAPTFAKAVIYCPKDTGKLAASGVLETSREGTLTKVSIGFARGGDPPYGVIVHERVDMAHTPPTRSKFLLAALEEDEREIQKRITDGYLARLQ